MKNVVAPVKNVVAAQDAFDNLCNRSLGVPGIGLIHGETGYGKTTAVTYLFNQVNGIYVRALSADTPSSLLGRVMGELGAQPMARTARMVDYILEHMSMYERPLFIDEADYLMDDVKLLETVRDLYDCTEVPVVLIGMDQIARRISTRRQFFNRISEWVEFKPADLEDVQIAADAMLDDGIGIDVDLLDELRRQAKGEMRTIAIGLDKIERLAKANELDCVTLAHWGSQPFKNNR
ncbi:DNA transposition protein [Zobellella denitrificans]|uniref:DNA transposition protein n=1 Tax=Zobellella denitrificans TaxID=347534 RepID=A0A291HQC1_9GAMM|nr:ATP-binding protein [Zobellella denitrificans]ATG74345.1 DNA transposition protein [Zobellella denitrificans]ATG74412.1 DNA transposition protein [Zobellella denitrificans]